MKIQLLSDLHMEAHPHWQATPLAGADVLVLAGDIGSYQPGSQLAGDDFGLERFSPCTAGRCRCCLCPATMSTTPWTLTSPTPACVPPVATGHPVAGT